MFLFLSSPWRIVAGSLEGAAIRMAFDASVDGAMGTGPGDMAIHPKCRQTPCPVSAEMWAPYPLISCNAVECSN
jgi:hypothetical protein